LKRRVAAAPLDDGMVEDLFRVEAELRAKGASTFALTAYLVCDRVTADRVLGASHLGLDNERAICRSASAAFAELFDPAVLRGLRAADVRDVGVALNVERMVDGMVSGIVYTCHPLTGDAREWLVRAGYGLASAVREARVPSDVMRLTRDGFLRDQVVVAKDKLEAATVDGKRELRDVPPPFVHEAALTRGVLFDVQRLAERVERHVGRPVRAEWTLANGQPYLVRVEPLLGHARPERTRAPLHRERELWSHSELGEAIPHVLTPLGWSLLNRFARAGLDSAVFASGVRLAESSELVNDVRGRAYLNLGLLTESACRMPGITPEALARVGLPVQADLDCLERAGSLEIARAALRVYDAHVRFGRKLSVVSTRVAVERGHFAGLDARLLSPDAVERVLRDVEHWLFDVGIALMRAYGVWLATLVGLRALLVRYAGDEALRLERDLVWGPDELSGIRTADDFAALARTLSRDSRALTWAENEEHSTPPAFVREAVQDFAARHGHEGVWVLDPASPRWRETPDRLEGALKALLSDPMGLSHSVERREVARGKRERAEREWKRIVPVALWPLVVLLLRRLRDLTKHRESLTEDTAQAISTIRDIARDASRRLEMRFRGIGADAAFFLELEELHAGLARGKWEAVEQVPFRRTERRVVSALPRAPSKFVGLPSAGEVNESLHGAAGSGGGAEGKVVRVTQGSELAKLGRASVLVVPACDVGLCAVLPAVRAVISERGGMLSHGAMLASALGVPVVVGVENACKLLADGERVRVDADRGVIERLRPST
jgi:pyruvate,water dikinase